jgi:hypothetical protein
MILRYTSKYLHLQVLTVDDFLHFLLHSGRIAVHSFTANNNNNLTGAALFSISTKILFNKVVFQLNEPNRNSENGNSNTITTTECL